MDKENIVITEKIAIGISACCMGSPVRYNGKGYNMLQTLQREKADFKWCPVCPESASGLGVPRDPIHLSGGNGDLVWLGEAMVKNRRGFDVTQVVKEGCEDSFKTLKRAGVSAYVYMDGSPTCGVYRTSLKDTKRGNPPGVFGSLLLKEELFLIPASDLQSPLKWWDARRRLLAFHWFKHLEIGGKKDLYDAWYKLKFLCQEIDDPFARDFGRRLADMKGKLEPEEIEKYRKEILEILRKPSTTRKITSSLWKNYAYYRKASGKTVEEVTSPEFKRNVTTIAKELVLMERTAFEDKVFFGTSPVIYRDRSRMRKLLSEAEMETTEMETPDVESPVTETTEIETPEVE